MNAFFLLKVINRIGYINAYLYIANSIDFVAISQERQQAVTYRNKLHGTEKVIHF